MVLLEGFISCSKHESHKLSTEVKNLAGSFSQESVFLDKNDFEKYNSLLKLTTNEDLISLTNHKKPTVRCYAFEALCERNYPEIREIFYNHENDTTESVIVGGGCIRDNISVRAYMFMALHPVSSKSKYKFSRTEFDPLFEKYFTRPAANSGLKQ